jgi:hypothetical protein
MVRIFRAKSLSRKEKPNHLGFKNEGLKFSLASFAPLREMAFRFEPFGFGLSGLGVLLLTSDF